MSVNHDKNEIEWEFSHTSSIKRHSRANLNGSGSGLLSLKKKWPKTTSEDEREDVLLVLQYKPRIAKRIESELPQLLPAWT